jgi:hypothetical protein
MELYLHSPMCLHGVVLSQRDNFTFFCGLYWHGVRCKFYENLSVGSKVVEGSVRLTYKAPLSS